MQKHIRSTKIYLNKQSGSRVCIAVDTDGNPVPCGSDPNDVWIIRVKDGKEFFGNMKNLEECQ